MPVAGNERGALGLPGSGIVTLLRDGVRIGFGSAGCRLDHIAQRRFGFVMDSNR